MWPGKMTLVSGWDDLRQAAGRCLSIFDGDRPEVASLPMLQTALDSVSHAIARSDAAGCRTPGRRHPLITECRVRTAAQRMRMFSSSEPSPEYHFEDAFVDAVR